MRISDWSSDVCSSDLLPAPKVGKAGRLHHGLAVEFLGRSLRHDVDDAARRGLSVENARRTFENLDLLHAKGIELGAGPLAAIGQPPAANEVAVGGKAAGTEATPEIGRGSGRENMGK